MFIPKKTFSSEVGRVKQYSYVKQYNLIFQLQQVARMQTATGFLPARIAACVCVCVCAFLDNFFGAKLTKMREGFT